MLSLIGIGGAGCRIVDNFYKRKVVAGLLTKFSNKKRGFVGVAVDTSDKITKLDNIPKSNMILIGKSRTKGHGTGMNVELGRKIMNEEAELVMNLMHKAGFKKDDLIIIFSGLGGGTGTGSIPVIAERIKKVYKAPLFGVFIIPSTLEGRVFAKNTSEYIQHIISSVDGVIILDNDVPMKKGGDMISTYRMVEESISNFFALAMSIEENILGDTLDKLSTMGFTTDRSKDISIKGTIEKMIRDDVFLQFDMHTCEKLVFIAKGDIDTFFDQDFARGWIKKKFDCEVEYIFQDEPNAKQTEMGLLIIGIKDLSNRFDEVKTKVEEKKRSELDELLGDIQSII